METGGRGKSYKGPKTEGAWHHQIRKVTGQRWALKLKKNTIDMPWVRPGTMAGTVPPALPRGLASQRCHREHQTNGWRDRKGWREGEEVEENKHIVLRVEKALLWTRQIAYVGEWGGERERDTKGQRKVKPGIFYRCPPFPPVHLEVIHNPGFRVHFLKV